VIVCLQSQGTDGKPVKKTEGAPIAKVKKAGQAREPKEPVANAA
jgi:hypothetical protein